MSVWVAVLLIQSIPYAAALLVSLVSALSLPATAGSVRPSTAHFRVSRIASIAYRRHRDINPSTCVAQSPRLLDFAEYHRPWITSCTKTSTSPAAAVGDESNDLAVNPVVRRHRRASATDGATSCRAASPSRSRRLLAAPALAR